MADIVIINPRFDVSFWGMESCVSLLGKQANLPVSCLALLAALVPEEHAVTLIDENVEPIDFDRISRADMVCVTGMSVQGERIRAVLTEAKRRGIFTVAGGPMATVEPEQIEDVADVIFIGEADQTWPRFIDEWSQGRHAKRYEQDEKTDLTTLPLPRIDLLKLDRYLFGSLQISRGCPFTCEFCDIIVTFGRKPRLKASNQVIAELEAFRSAGMRIVFVVDDNLIGNKKAIKPMLRDIAGWQRREGYPLVMFTEASLDLADDDELMELMGEAGFQSVFIGIESPNDAALKETKKLQNVRPRAGTMIERVHRIQNRGFDVWCGMIVGFDSDDSSVFEAMARFLDQARIANALVGMLHAIPTTPLHDRLKKEGRLNSDDDSDQFGTNVVPLHMGRGELRDGFARVMHQLYEPDAYFRRVDALLLSDSFELAFHRIGYWRAHRFGWLRRAAGNYAKFAGIAFRLLTKVDHRDLRRVYAGKLAHALRTRALRPHILCHYAIKAALHYHYARITSEIGAGAGDMPNAARSFSRSRHRLAEAPPSSSTA